MDRRAELARMVTETLESQPGVSAVVPYGSLPEGRADRYSDIDLRVELRGVSDRTFAERVPGLLRPIGEYVIEAWGPTALPDRFIRVLHFADYPLFWHVDIWCDGDTHVDGSDLEAQDHWPLLFRVWVDELKKILRGAQDTRVMDRFAQEVMDIDDLPLSLRDRLGVYLDRFHQHTRSRGAPCDEVFARCDALRREYLATGSIEV